MDILYLTLGHEKVMNINFPDIAGTLFFSLQVDIYSAARVWLIISEGEEGAGELGGTHHIHVQYLFLCMYLSQPILLPTGYACTFEDDLCGWTTGEETGFTWIRGRSQSPEDNTGPYIDHTTLSPVGEYEGWPWLVK